MSQSGPAHLRFFGRSVSVILCAVIVTMLGDLRKSGSKAIKRIQNLPRRTDAVKNIEIRQIAEFTLLALSAATAKFWDLAVCLRIKASSIFAS